MEVLVALVGISLIVIVLWDAFEAIVLPRRVTRRFRLIRAFYRITWVPCRFAARRIRTAKRREALLSFFGPLSLILLFIVWAISLVLGFAMLQWSFGTQLNSPEGTATFGTHLYLSGTTFFTLGFGDVTPRLPFGRALAVLEAGTGLGFIAIVIGYLPVLYQAFSRREVNISLLDARAGSPPSAAVLLRRHNDGDGMNELVQLLRDWERWSAELMESHLSYPVLCFFRSQHDNQSWLAALTTILDTSAIVSTGMEGTPARQARLTFAIARHAVVDLSQIFNTPPLHPEPDRLPPADLRRMRTTMAADGVVLRDEAEADQKLSELRGMYDPYVNALANYLFITLPPWDSATKVTADNWQTSAWGRSSAGLASNSPLLHTADDEHF